MKKQLFTLMLAAAASVTAVAQTNTLCQLEELTNKDEPLTGFAGTQRQATFVNGKMYLQDGSTGVATVWNENGVTTETLTTTKKYGIAHDDAGNIILPGTTQNTWAGTKAPSLTVIKPDGTVVEKNITPLTTTGFGYLLLGNAKGDVTGDGEMYIPLKSKRIVMEIKFTAGEGKVVCEREFTETDFPETFEHNSIAYPCDGGYIVARRNNQLVNVQFTDAEHSAVTATKLTTPNRRAMNGSSIFDMGGKTYVIYDYSAVAESYVDGIAIGCDNALIASVDKIKTANSSYPNLSAFAKVKNDYAATIYSYVAGTSYRVYDFKNFELPAQIYVAGLTNGRFNDATEIKYPLTQLEAGSPIYTGSWGVTGYGEEGATNDYGYFTFLVKEGADKDDWSYSFGPATDGTEIIDGGAAVKADFNGFTKFKLAANREKRYDFTVNLATGDVSVKLGTGTVGVEEVGAKAAVKAVGGAGEIRVYGEAKNVQVYNLGGALISEGETEIACPAGVYIVRADGVATKVVVK